MKRSLAFQLLQIYGSALPYHPGKGQIHDRLRKFFNVRVDEQFDVVREGLRWRLNPADFVQATLFWLGRNDHYDLYHLQRLLKPDCVFFDIGANFGYYTVSVAARLKGCCQVHAFEPNPTTMQLLRHHITINGLENCAYTHDVAISDQAGEAQLATKAGNSGGTHVVSSGEGTIPITISTLDSFCEQHGIAHIDAMKIDVEGFEERLLLGGRETLRRLQPMLVIELEPPRLRDKGSTPERVTTIIKELGYNLYVSHRKELKPLLDLPEGDSYQINAFCIPRSRKSV